jgi:hypothetical protein
MTQRDDEIAQLKGRLAALEGKPAAPVAAPKKGIGCFGVGALVVGGLFVFGAIVSALSPAKPPAPAASGSSTGGANSVTAPPLQTWSYSSFDDEMGRGTTRLACITSVSEIHLEWPYKDQKPEFCLRRGPKFGFDSYLTLPGEGQFLCHIDRCRVKVRFDDGAAQIYQAQEASDGSSNVIFIPAAAKIAAALKSAKRMRIEAEFYQAGLQVSDFEAAGFDADQLAPAKPPAKPKG